MVKGGWTVFAVMPWAATVKLNCLTKAVMDELPSALGSEVALEWRPAVPPMQITRPRPDLRRYGSAARQQRM